MREIADPGDLRIVVRDESWKQLRLGVEAVKSFDADLRLSRRDGDIQFALAHKPSDLLSVGDAGSQAAAIAKDLLHLADTKILHGQDQAVADELRSLLGLPDSPSTSSPTGAAKPPAAPCGCVGEQHVQGPDRAAPRRDGPDLDQRRPGPGRLEVRMNIDGFGGNFGLLGTGSLDRCSGSGNLVVPGEVGMLDRVEVAGRSGDGEAEQVADPADVAAGGVDLVQDPVFAQRLAGAGRCGSTGRWRRRA